MYFLATYRETLLRRKLRLLLRVQNQFQAKEMFVSKSRSVFYFLQHENLLHKEAIIRAINNLTLQPTIAVGKNVVRIAWL